jgi:hypothetical protein
MNMVLVTIIFFLITSPNFDFTFREDQNNLQEYGTHQSVAVLDYLLTHCRIFHPVSSSVA